MVVRSLQTALLQRCPGGPWPGSAGYGGRDECWVLVLGVQEPSNELTTPWHKVHQCEWQVLVVTHCKEEQHEGTDSVADLFFIAPVLP